MRRPLRVEGGHTTWHSRCPYKAINDSAMQMTVRTAILALTGTILLVAGPAQAQTRKPPYWASISRDEARMRVGPSLDYPASWVYQRRDLPLKVIEVLDQWRKVEDPDGTQGWMHVSLLSGRGTAIIKGGVAPLRAAASPDAKILYRAEPGVVGRISDCDKNWCAIDVRGQRGFVEIRHIWGAVE